MATAAGGLSLVESDRLAFLQQENKASWRKVSLHSLSPARSPWMAAAASWVRAFGAEAALPVARVSAAQNLPGGQQQ